MNIKYTLTCMSIYQLKVMKENVDSNRCLRRRLGVWPKGYRSPRWFWHSRHCHYLRPLKQGESAWPCGDKDIVPRQEQIEVEDMNRMSSPLSYPDLDHLFGQDNNIKTLLLYYIFSDFVWNLHKFRSGHFSQRWKFLITQPNAAS